MFIVAFNFLSSVFLPVLMTAGWRWEKALEQTGGFDRYSRVNDEFRKFFLEFHAGSRLRHRLARERKKWGVTCQNLALPFLASPLSCATSGEDAQTLHSPQENLRLGEEGGLSSSKLPPKVAFPAQNRGRQLP